MQGAHDSNPCNNYYFGTEYVGNIEYSYEDDCDYLTKHLSKVYHPEGYVSNIKSSTGVPVYNYYRRDHLGSIREVWAGNTQQTIQRTWYYPSGLPIEKGYNPDYQQRKYNGKEWIEAHGLDVTDLGNRGLYHAINRFTSIDRFAEKYPWQSPYVHAGNNPVNYVDVNGDAAIWGVIIGAGLDYGIQVAGNIIENRGLSINAFTNVDKKSIAVSAVTGAAGVGLASKFNQVVKLINLGKTATTAATIAGEAAIDASLSAGSQLIENGEVSLGKVAVDVIAGAVGGKAGGDVKAAKQASSEGKILHRQADRAQRLAKGNNPKASRIEKAQQATKKAENYGKTQAVATSVATSTTISNTIEEIEKIKRRLNR